MIKQILEVVWHAPFCYISPIYSCIFAPYLLLSLGKPTLIFGLGVISISVYYCILSSSFGFYHDFNFQVHPSITQLFSKYYGHLITVIAINTTLYPLCPLSITSIVAAPLILVSAITNHKLPTFNLGQLVLILLKTSKHYLIIINGVSLVHPKMLLILSFWINSCLSHYELV